MRNPSRRCSTPPSPDPWGREILPEPFRLPTGTFQALSTFEHLHLSRVFLTAASEALGLPGPVFTGDDDFLLVKDPEKNCQELHRRLVKGKPFPLDLLYPLAQLPVGLRRRKHCCGFEGWRERPPEECGKTILDPDIKLVSMVGTLPPHGVRKSQMLDAPIFRGGKEDLIWVKEPKPTTEYALFYLRPKLESRPESRWRENVLVEDIFPSFTTLEELFNALMQEIREGVEGLLSKVLETTFTLHYPHRTLPNPAHLGNPSLEFSSPDFGLLEALRTAFKNPATIIPQ